MIKAFLMKNVPEDKILLLDFVEGTLDIDVKRVECFRNLALVTLETDSINLETVSEELKKNQDDIDERTGELEVLDPGLDENVVVVDELDDNYLSLQELKLYIESTFADGHEVVSGCQTISEYNWTVLSFTAPNVVTQILEKEEHTPLPSEDYHILIKPFYKNFHSVLMKNTIQSKRPPDDVFLSDNDEGNRKSGDTVTDGSNGVHNKTVMKKEPNEGLESKESLKSSTETKVHSAEPEKETIKIPKLYHKLLKDRLSKFEPLNVNYLKEEVQLTIVSKDADEIKGLLQKVNKSTKQLTEKEMEYLGRDKVNNVVTGFGDLNGDVPTKVKIDGTLLTVHSLGNSKGILEELIERVLSSQNVILPEGIRIPEIRQHLNNCKNNYLVIMDIGDNSITLKGLSEDVSNCSDDVNKIIETYRCTTETFKLTGNDALFVNSHQMKELKEIFRNAAEYTEKETNYKEIVIQYKCTKSQMSKINEQLQNFKGSIKKSKVDLGTFKKEDIDLVKKNLKKDTEVIEHFQKVNHCCVVGDFKDDGLFGASTASKREKEKRQTKGREQSVPGFHQKQNRVKRILSCKLQIKPFGNIIRERTDLLVCGVDRNLNLNKTNVSKAFSKQDGSLQDQMASYVFSDNGVCVDQRNLPNTKCKAIAFVTLGRWQSGVSDQHLMEAVLEVLDIANKIGMTSISIPPLGFSRVFKFPADEASKAVISAIDSFLKANGRNSNITLINYLAPDKGLYYAMNKIVDDCFGKDEDEKDCDNNNDSEYLDAAEGGEIHSKNSSGEDDEASELKMEALKSKTSLSIVIVHNNGRDIASKFKDEISKKWLFEHYYKLDKMTCISLQFMNEVIKDAKDLGVWVENISNTKEHSLKLKGKHGDVQKMIDKINDKIPRDLVSPLAPKRGTVDFIKYACECRDNIPSYWTGETQDGKGCLVDVTQTHSTKAVMDLMQKCWDQQQAGKGHDAANIPANSQIKVIKVERLENASLFLKYNGKRKEIFRNMKARKRLCKDIGKLNGSKGPPTTMQDLPEFMKKEIYSEINEMYLFHGTKLEIKETIKEQGMDARLSNRNGMFGQGVYMAESSTKSDQYADDRNERVPHGTKLLMILTRATMGDVFLCDDKHESVQEKTSRKLMRPPCMNCLQDRCTDRCTCTTYQFHSVLGDGKWVFREFVVYEGSQCYPEYFITYQRH